MKSQKIALLGAGAYTDSEHIDFISRKLWDEVMEIATATGISLPPYRI